MCPVLVSLALESPQVNMWENNLSITLNRCLKYFSLLSATRSQTEEYKRFAAADKENLSAKRDGETLILAKDSGKQFTSGSSVHIGGGQFDTSLSTGSYSYK